MGKKYGVAIIGISLEGIGNSHARAVIGNSETELVVICESNEEWAKDRSKFYDVPYCTDYHELLDRDDIDIAIVCTPDYLHAEMTCDFLAAGKHVLCEKPLAGTVEDCQKMIDASKKTDKKLMVGQVCRYTPSFALAKKLVDAGTIGRLAYIESEYSHNYGKMGEDNWRFHGKSMRHNFTGGGCHSVDLLRWFAGNPTEVFAYGNHILLGPEFGPCDDTMCALMKFPNDIVGRVFVSVGCQSPGTGTRTLLYGTKGTLIMQNYGSVRLYLTDFDFEGRSELIPEQAHEAYLNGIDIPVPQGSHNMSGELADFLEEIKNDREVKLSVYEGSATIAVCEAAIRSSKTGKAEEIKYCER